MAREATPTPVYRDLADGETYEVPGKPPGKCYIIKNSGGVYSCSDPSWRNQGAPTNRRTCKHIKALRGEAAELLRIGDGMAAPRTRRWSRPRGPRGARCAPTRRLRSSARRCCSRRAIGTRRTSTRPAGG